MTRPRRVGDRGVKHVAFYFPGGYMPGDDLVERRPHAFVERLAWVTLRALERTRATVEPILYDAYSFLDFDRFRAGVVRDVTAALERHGPDRVTLVGKSMGGHALCVIVEEQLDLPEDARLIWLTPVWGRDPTWEAARATTIPSLYVVGLADHEYHVPERHAVLPGRTVAIEGADHRFEVAGDVFATLDAWRQMAEAVLAFASRAESW